MRKVLWCSLVCISLSCLCSAYGNIDKSSTDNADSNKCNVAKNYEGTTVGVGFNVGIQKAVAEANREFRGTSSSVRSTNFGGTITLGWQKNICGNCFVGVEGGIDFGGSKSVAVGGVLKDDSQIALEEKRRRSLLSKAFLELAHEFSQFNRPFSPTYVVDQVSWRNLIGTLRYLGSTPGSADANGFPADITVRDFMTSPGNGGAFFDTANYNGTADVSLPNSSLADFVPNTIRTVSQNGDVLSALRDLRNYVAYRHPHVVVILQNIAQGVIDSPVLWNEHPTAPSPIYDPAVAANVPDLAVYVIGRFLAGEASLLIGDLDDVGVPNVFPGNTPDERVEFAENALLALHFSEVGSDTLPSAMEKRIMNQVQTKTSFGICPHIAFKIGYFLKEINGYIYAKFGIIQLAGRVTPTTGIYDISEEKFNKITPLIAFGISKNISDKCGITFEISHALKTSKNLQDIRIFNRYTLKHKVSISKTSLRALITYNF